jgi:hypothetical protein
LGLLLVFQLLAPDLKAQERESMIILCFPQSGRSNRYSIRFRLKSLSEVIWRGLDGRRPSGSRILGRLLRRWQIELPRVIGGRLMISNSGCGGLSILHMLWSINCSLSKVAWVICRTATVSDLLGLGLRNRLIHCVPTIRTGLIRGIIMSRLVRGMMMSGLIRRLASEANRVVERLRLC